MKRKICFFVVGLIVILNVKVSASSNELANFNDLSKWDKSGVTIKNKSETAEITVNNEGSISQEFCYNIDSFPYLVINIPKMDAGISWNLEVLSDNQAFILQKTTENYNQLNQENDQFIYPLKGYMIQNLKKIPDCYTLKLNFQGTGVIELNNINAVTFDQSKDYQFNGYDGDFDNMLMGGDPSLDIDSLKNDVPISEQLTKEHHWGVYPLSRLALYPTQSLETINNNLNLSVSAFYGVNDKGTYKASPELSDFNQISLGGESAKAVDTYWLPYMIGINATYSNGSLDVSDYFIDKDTIGRKITNNSSEKIKIEITNPENGKWTNEANQFIFESNSELNKYYYVMSFKQDYELNQTDTGYILEFNPGADIDMALGFATKDQGVNYAKQNSEIINSTQSDELINDTKNMWQNLLRIVPAPKTFGVESQQGDISSEDHKLLYYSAWTYLIGNMMEPTDETGYQFGQQLLGKASMQTEGAPISSGNNSWESILQLQLISLINPSFAEDAIYGFLSMVDANGELDGEVLPTRFAQTIWIIYNSSGNLDFLAKTYPSLKRFMEYKATNLHWIWGSTDTKDEVDSEFVISWLFDSTYIQKIANELGYSSEVTYWQELYDELLAKYYEYFFVDPESLEAQGAYPSGTNGVRTDGHPADKSTRGIWQRYYLEHFNSDGSNMHNNVRGNLPENVHMILSGLIIDDLEPEYQERLMQLFEDVYAPNLTLSGFTNYKYGPNSLLMYSLLENGMVTELQTLLKNDLAKANKVWTFCELFKYDSDAPQGTLPTSFSTNLIIENTMMLNGINYFNGTVTEN